VAPAWPLACWDCGFEFAGCVVRERSLRQADHSSRGVLPSVVCLRVISKPQQREGLGLLLNHLTKKNSFIRLVLRVACGFSACIHCYLPTTSVIVCQHVLRHTRFDVCTAVIFRVNFANVDYVRHVSSSVLDPATARPFFHHALRGLCCLFSFSAS
jgi:hypothetical protein